MSSTVLRLSPTTCRARGWQSAGRYHYAHVLEIDRARMMMSRRLHHEALPLLRSQVGRFRAEGWDLLFARTVALIAECERVMDHRADLVKSCMELLDPKVAAALTDSDVTSITGTPADNGSLSSTRLRSSSASNNSSSSSVSSSSVSNSGGSTTVGAVSGPGGTPAVAPTEGGTPVRSRAGSAASGGGQADDDAAANATLLSVCDRLCRFLASTSKSITVDLAAGKVDVRVASPSGWHARDLGSPAFPLPDGDGGVGAGGSASSAGSAVRGATTPLERSLESPLPSTVVSPARGVDDDGGGGLSSAGRPASPSAAAAAFTTATHSLRPVMRTSVDIKPLPVSPPLVQPLEDAAPTALTSDQAFEVCRPWPRVCGVAVPLQCSAWPCVCVCLCVRAGGACFPI